MDVNQMLRKDQDIEEKRKSTQTFSKIPNDILMFRAPNSNQKIIDLIHTFIPENINRALEMGYMCVTMQPNLFCEIDYPDETFLSVLYNILEGKIDSYSKKDPFSSMAASFLYNLFGFYKDLFDIEFEKHQNLLELLLEKTNTSESYKRLHYFLCQHEEQIENVIELGIPNKAYLALDNQSTYQYSLQVLQLIREHLDQDTLIEIFNKVVQSIDSLTDTLFYTLEFIRSLMPAFAELLFSRQEFQQMIQIIPEMNLFQLKNACELIDVLVASDTVNYFYNNNIIEVLTQVVATNMEKTPTSISFRILANVISLHKTAFNLAVVPPLGNVLLDLENYSQFLQTSASRVIVALLEKRDNSSVISFFNSNDVNFFSIMADVLYRDFCEETFLVIQMFFDLVSEIKLGKSAFSEKLLPILNSSEFNESLESISQSFDKESETQQNASVLAEQLLDSINGL
ncbi:hypothetical protein TVAG_049660 [Trichomonas vaginalis G3]|uniref:Uncharacterized protein n=1 Tax=Trichomonas vaginalis (strain ATCC PRA-98 / G3) TaxID=412133 RepID=A2EVW1_TRIV3|nr:hypothetical protein TVAGG3_0548190 [Trichomonas vaginalis G3]EAY03182.1 hypothetical protein TVAG_049660 [Trichomonas vaginalis G3]KAI5520323.1 hypothetical protein TVAGG3_0548190 [Trichomonas vaginalis G3]|eukprot:XP_001315405.1 hypothetical protein [Trichomonas vaginalis G3]